MAWIESHQELRDHPKVKRLARLLDISVPEAIGHMHCLWWWAVDYATDGDVSRFDALDLADAAMWCGDPERFAKALVECGPSDQAGFLDVDWRLHDWGQYVGGILASRDAGARGNHVRWHVQRGVIEPSCTFCESGANRGRIGGDIPPDSGGTI